MTDASFSQVKKAISTSRMSTYRGSEQLSSDSLLGKYIWNVKLSENFYFLLQNLEISLRNAIYDAYLLHYPNKEFFYLYQTDSRRRYQNRKEFHSRECWKMISGINYKFSRLDVLVTDEKRISELNFGFWTEILSSNHTQYTDMWRKIFKDVFPNIVVEKGIDQTKIVVAQKINNIRKFRNRIFHYEPIFNRDDLDQMHSDILEVIAWINTDLQKLTLIFDAYGEIKSQESKIVKKLVDFGKGDK